MRKDVRILFVDTFERNIQTIIDALEHKGYNVIPGFADCKVNLIIAIYDMEWDLVLCSNTLPTLSPQEAINAVKESDSGLPLVVVAESFDENEALRLINKGCRDYVKNDDYLSICRIIIDIEHQNKVIQSQEILSEHNRENSSMYKNMLNAFTYNQILLDDECNPFDFIILEVNDAFVKNTGLKRENIIGRKGSELFPEIMLEYKKMIDIAGRVAMEGQVYKWADFYSETYSKWFVISAYSPKQGYFALVFTDITEQKLAEEEAKKAIEVVNTAYKAKSKFLANMSHELRTPLNGILGMINLTLMSDLTEEQRENLTIAKSSADSLLNIINDILDISKVEAGKMSLERIEFDIRSLVEKTIKLHSVLAVEKNIKLLSKYADNIPQIVYGDPNRLQQVINNIVGNAVKFTDEGSVCITIESRHDVECDDGTIEIRFSVEDTGVGISEEEMQELFKSFSQVNNSYTRKNSGTGLGLVISKHLVEIMGGTIWARSQKGKGSTFFFSVKLYKTGKPNKSKENSCFEMKTTNPINILLVEDDIINQTVTGKMLKEMGHRYEAVNNGWEALEILRHKEFDMILMDIEMPEMNGIQTTAAIRNQRNHYSNIPIIAHTAHALEGDREKFLAQGMNDYLPKPYQIKDLSTIIEQYATNQKHIFGDNYLHQPDKYMPVVEDINDIFTDIEKYISRIKEALIVKDLFSIEEGALKIRQISEVVCSDTLRKLAFKVILEVRRGNTTQLEQLLAQIEKEVDTFREL